MAALSTSLHLKSSLALQSLTAPLPHAASSRRARLTSLVCSSQRGHTNRVAQQATLAAASSLAFPSLASALEAEQIVSAFDQVEALSKQAVDVATQALDAAKVVSGQVYDAAAPVVEAATPVVKEATKAAAESLRPVASEVADQAQKALASSGLEIAPVLSAAKSAVVVAGDVTEKAGAALQAASPYAQATLDTVLAQEPAVIAAGAGALVLLYLLLPAFFGSIAYSARGYAGEYSAAQALDLLSKDDFTLVDVRSDSQRAKAGVPALPRNAKKKLVSVPVEDLPGKLRGQIRNARKVEAEIAAIKISSLKRLSKGSKIILIDSNGDLSKLVAQSLAALGLRNTWVVKDGMDGGQGWIQSQLGTDSAGGLSLAEVLSPSRIISGSSRSGTVQVPARKAFLLPSAD